LLGQLTPSARRRFEAQLAEDAALRQTVRELEEGLVTLASSVPPLRPPPAAWANIQASINRPRWKFFPWPSVRLGWAGGALAFAACVSLGFFGHALWVSQTAPSSGKNSARIKSDLPAAIRTAANSASTNGSDGVRPSVNSHSTAIASKAGATSERSTSINDPEKLPANSNPAVRGRTRFTPQAQRAMLLAVARQMGRPELAVSQSGEKVDFVTLPYTSQKNLFTAEAAPLVESALAPALNNLSLDPADEIPIILVDRDPVVFIDPATLPADSGPVVVWGMGSDGNPWLIGSVPVGANPTVITIDGSYAAGATTYFVEVGGTNLLGRITVGN